MTRISKKKLQRDVLLRLHKRFADSLAKISTENQANQFLNALLSETERIMLGKRLATIVMISEGLSTYKIRETLGVSVSTTLLMREKYDTGEYSFIVSFYKKKENCSSFWDDLDVLLRLGMPRYSGKDRWDFLNTNKARYK